MPHLPGGSVSPEIGEHSGEPVIDLIQGQLPVGGFQNGLWAREKQRDPQSEPSRVTGLCSLPPAWPDSHPENRGCPLQRLMDRTGGCRPSPEGGRLLPG